MRDAFKLATFANSSLLVVLLMVWVSLFSAGCNKKCQTLPTTPYKTITATPWRMVNSTNPGLRGKLDAFNTQILSFRTNFVGDLKNLANNNETTQAVYTFTFNVKSEGRTGLLRLQFSQVDPNAKDGSGGSQSSGSTDPDPPIDYSYDLSNTLTLTELKTGYSYDYVPYKGIVDPDDNCTF